MTRLRFLWNCLSDDRGATALEYALLAALIAGGLVAAAGATGPALARLFSDADATLEAEIGDATP